MLYFEGSFKGNTVFLFSELLQLYLLNHCFQNRLTSLEDSQICFLLWYRIRSVLRRCALLPVVHIRLPETGLCLCCTQILVQFINYFQLKDMFIFPYLQNQAYTKLVATTIEDRNHSVSPQNKLLLRASSSD